MKKQIKATYFKSNNLESLKIEFRSLMKIHHPDVSGVDSNSVCQEILLEYNSLLDSLSKNSTSTIIKNDINDIKKKIMTAVVIYEAKAHYNKEDGKHYKLSAIKSYRVRDDVEAERQIKNLKAQKLYPFLTAKQLHNIDRNGYVASIVYDECLLLGSFIARDTKEFFKSCKIR